jgi:hypothetical protein
MTMKTRKTFIAAAIVAVLSCSAAHAQVLVVQWAARPTARSGGGIGNSSVFGGGNAAGSFGGELDTGSMIHRTRGVADQTSQRARNVGTNVRNRTESTVATAHDKSASVATSAAAATQAAKDQQMRNTTNVAGATASQLDATSFSTGTEGASSHSSVIESPVEPQPAQGSGRAEVRQRLDGSEWLCVGQRVGLAPQCCADVAADGNGAASFNSKQDDTQQ